MIKVDQLLSKAIRFEKAALAFFKKAISIHSSMEYALSKLLGKNIYQEDINGWAEKNSPVFNILPDLQYLPWTHDFYRKNLAGGNFIRTSYWDDSDATNKYFYIGTTSAQPHIVKLIESFILQGYGEIPNLWVFFGTEGSPADVVPNVNITKEMAHEKWLIDALSLLFYRTEDYRGPEFIDDVKRLLIDSKDKINYFRTKWFTGTPKILGEPGADGVAIAISDRLVLKLFRTENAFIQAQRSMERLHKHPELAKTEAMIYDAGIFGQCGPSTLYYYIMERMIPVESLGNQVRDGLEDIKNYMWELIQKKKSYFKSLKKLINQPEKHSELKSLILQFATKLVELSMAENDIQIEQIENELYGRLNKNWLYSFAQELIVKELTDRRDLHMGNVGLTKYKDFRYFDPVYRAPASVPSASAPEPSPSESVGF